MSKKMELKNYIAVGKSLDPAESDDFEEWVDFTRTFLAENYGQKRKNKFTEKTTIPVYPVDPNSRARLKIEENEDRRRHIEKGLKYLKSLEGYDIEENTMVKKKNRRDNPVNHQPQINIKNEATATVTVESALVMLQQQAQGLPPKEKSKVMKALELVGNFLGVAVGTAAGQVLKDKV